MNEKTIRKYLHRQFSPLGWSLLGYYGLMYLFAGAALTLDLLAWEMGIPWLDPDGNGWGYLLAAATAVVIAWGWKGREFWREQIWAREAPLAWKDFAMALCLCAGVQMVNSLWILALEGLLNGLGLSALGVLDTVSGQSDTVSMFLYSAIAAPLVEEILFRGYLLRSLRPWGKRFAILASAVMFGLFHGNLLQAPYAFCMGLLLGYLAVEHGLRWAVGVHLFNNLVLADLLSRLLEWLPVETANWLDLLIFGGALVVSIPIVLRRRKQILAYIRSEWMDRRVLRCFFTSPGVVALGILMIANMLLALVPL